LSVRSCYILFLLFTDTPENSFCACVHYAIKVAQIGFNMRHGKPVQPRQLVQQPYSF